LKTVKVKLLGFVLFSDYFLKKSYAFGTILSGLSNLK
jgi:hypothetical protein